jgi:CarD family transcriptional regulator
MGEFKIGDKLTHLLHAVGTLVSIKRQRKNDAVTDRCVMEWGPNQARRKTSVDKGKDLGLRNPISEKDRGELVRIFAERPRRLAQDYQKRRSDIVDTLREGNLVEIGRVVRDLAWRKERGKADVWDRLLLERAKALLAEQLAVCERIEVHQAMERIKSMLERRVST